MGSMACNHQRHSPWHHTDAHEKKRIRYHTMPARDSASAPPGADKSQTKTPPTTAQPARTHPSHQTAQEREATAHHTQQAAPSPLKASTVRPPTAPPPTPAETPATKPATKHTRNRRTCVETRPAERNTASRSNRKGQSGLSRMRYPHRAHGTQNNLFS